MNVNWYTVNCWLSEPFTSARWALYWWSTRLKFRREYEQHRTQEGPGGAIYWWFMEGLERFYRSMRPGR